MFETILKSAESPHGFKAGIGYSSSNIRLAEARFQSVCSWTPFSMTTQKESGLKTASSLTEMPFKKSFV